MPVSYNKLWKILIDKKLKRTDLITMADLSSATLAKMGKDQQVSMDVITRICNALGCNVGDIMDIVPSDDK
ncbi:MAG: Cro/Cl family transcriptional regulator [Firmicutes bacterium HGW-Firmicutes-4]|nr:MAG: Cro/Cl family transcriptional regulator [Firmicutes bacterium HGW-Firmicutes-4]